MNDKSILVIDTPKSCADCRLKKGLFCGESGNSLYDYIHYDDSINDKPSWCPLRPLPQKIVGKQAKYIPAYSLGRNEVIDEIIGETE